MKKLFGLIAIMALGLTTAFAQTPAAVKTASAKKMVTKEVKTVTVPAHNHAKAATATVATSKTKVETTKKDGTPDMRFKANKTAKKTK